VPVKRKTVRELFKMGSGKVHPIVEEEGEEEESKEFGDISLIEPESENKVSMCESNILK
jgi:hypothetical protein